MSIDWSAGHYRCPDSEMGANPSLDWCWHEHGHDGCARQDDIPEHVVIDSNDNVPLCPLYIRCQHVQAALAVMAQNVNPLNPMAIADHLGDFVEAVERFLNSTETGLLPTSLESRLAQRQLRHLRAPPKD